MPVGAHSTKNEQYLFFRHILIIANNESKEKKLNFCLCFYVIIAMI